ncbi:MAG: efflux RND transporter periplasmic adaptor subunit [Hyphomicrobium sp.]|nr:efflux RND transporter periplasmic adaptor subunit [Hyphomicrobium sp.]
MKLLSHFLLAAFLVLAAAWPAAAHEGHVHADEAAPTAMPSTGPQIESSGSVFELVATARGHELTIYLDRADTNVPVDGATIEITTDGKPPVMAKPIGTGTYQAEATWLDEPGAKPLVFTVMAGEEADLLNGVLQVSQSASAAAEQHSLPELLAQPISWLLIAGGVIVGVIVALLLRPASRGATVLLFMAGALVFAVPLPAEAHEGHDHAEETSAAAMASGHVPRRQPDGSVFVPKATQRLLNVRTQPVREETAPRTFEAIGTVIADPSAFGRVQAPMDGLVELGDHGLPYVGQRVQAGQVLARLSPTIPIADLGTMQQLRAEVAGKLKVAEQKLSRLSRISTVVAQSDIEDTRAELEALREQRRVLEEKDIEKFELKAPVGGVISVANVRAGQVVSGRDTLFEILDPDRLWVEAAGADIHGDDDIAGGVAYDADGHTLSLAYIGRSPTLRQQSQSLLFRLTEPHTGLAAGASVTVVAQRSATDTGIILAEDAVVRGVNGLPQVWVKTSPQQFKPVLVTSRPLDGVRVLITAGLDPGDRVVTRGAELINQIR